MYHLLEIMLYLFCVPILLIEKSIKQTFGYDYNASFIKSYLIKKSNSSNDIYWSSIHHRNTHYLSDASAASSKALTSLSLSNPCTPNQLNGQSFPNSPINRTPRRITHPSSPTFPSLSAYQLLHEPLDEPCITISKRRKYHRDDIYLEGKPYVYDPKDIEIIIERIILSLPINASSNLDFLEGNIQALIQKNIFTEEWPLSIGKTRNLIIFSGEKIMVDAFSLVLYTNYTDVLNMIQIENKDGLRYLAMYYDHTISLFRSGIMELITKIHEIGRNIKEEFEILFYCHPQQYEKCLMLSIMIEIYYKQILNGTMDYVSFIGVISTPKKSLKELNKVYRNHLSDYRQIFVIDHNQFDVSSYSYKSRCVRLNPFKLELDWNQRNNFMNLTEYIAELCASDTTLYDLQSVIHQYFKH